MDGRAKKIVIVSVLVIIISIGLFAYYLATQLGSESLVQVSGTANANAWYGVSFTIDKAQFNQDEITIEVAIRLQDADTETTYHLFACDVASCITILPARDGFDSTSGAELVIGLKHVDSNSVVFQFQAANTGVDKYYYLIFVQTVDFVQQTGYQVSIDLAE